MTLIIIILLICLVIYLYYQNRKLAHSKDNSAGSNSTAQTVFDQNQEDLIADRDQAIRAKNEAEQELTSVSNKLKLKQQEVNRKDQALELLKSEKSQVEIALNAKLKELKEKYSKQGKLLDEEQTDNNKLAEQISQLETKIAELEAEKKNLLAEVNKHHDLDEFQAWLNESEENKANLPDWDKIITEIKDKIRDYHLAENNWASGLLKRNSKYYQVFKNWIEND